VDNLFGIPMTSIMVVLVAMFAVGVASIAFVAITNRHMFLMGLRNLPRRGLQTGLVVVGLMLATLITTASFVTGDTVDYSIEKYGYDLLQRTDLSVNFQGEDGEQATRSVYAAESAVDGLEAQFAGDPDIDGFLPLLFEPAPVRNERTGLSEPRLTLSGIDPVRLEALGGLRLVDGGRADLAVLDERAVLLTESAADDLDARSGDTVTVYIGEQPAQLVAVGIVQDELVTSGLRDFDVSGSGGAVVRLDVAQRLTGHAGRVNFISVALQGGVSDSHRHSDAVISRLEPFLQSAEGAALLDAGNHPVDVEALKQDVVAKAESTGNMFVTFFLVLGLFSIASGVLLIFMIFVMLAAERRAEMGMARAVGAQRSNLVQAFVSEGMAYNLIAGAIGTALGVAAALGLVVVFLKIAVGDDFDFVTAHVTWQSLVISYCLGVSLTFVTVVIASIKVTSLNIVAAVRGLEDEPKREARRGINWKWVAIGVPSMVVPPLGAWFLFRKGLGISWAWILAPAGAAIAAIAILGAKGGGSTSEFLAGFGFSVLPLCLAMLAAHYRVPGRLVWTLVGAWLAFYWLSPFSVAEEVLGTEMKGDIEMFVLSGIMVVAGFTLVIVFNARLLTSLFQRKNGHRYRKPAVIAGLAAAIAAAGVAIGDRGDGVGQVLYVVAGLIGLGAAAAWAAVRFSAAAPALKMGVAYPLSNSFRTGLTIAIFSLIVFSIVVFSAVNANFTATMTGDNGDGGWDVVATSNRNNPVDDVTGMLRDRGASVAGDISNSGRTTTFTGSQQILDGDEWMTYPVIAGDAAFYGASNATLAGRARGYDSDRAVLEAVGSDVSLALVDATEFGPYDFTWTVEKADGFEPFAATFRNPLTGAESTVTVIGVLGTRLNAEIIAGLYVNEAAYQPVFGEPSYERTYIELENGTAVKESARAIESALASSGVQAESIKQLIDDSAAQDRAFTRMFQGFMALGLIVGIVALGVIAFRSVVERRQQIGMLRAIGYQTGTVALTFVLESSFIALMGILSGMVGGVIISRNLFTTGQFAGEGVEFMMPWTEVLVFTAAALVVSLAMTWWPSRAAARVPVADALRYE
jgi:putative ABC transport system permease protein